MYKYLLDGVGTAELKLNGFDIMIRYTDFVDNDPLCDAIATQTDIIQLENVYLTQNFLWYKDRDDFDGLLLISIPNMKTAMIKNSFT